MVVTESKAFTSRLQRRNLGVEIDAGLDAEP